MALNAGTKLGPYEIVEAAGAGGMGEVYRARDTRLNRDVAVKVLPEQFSQNPDLKQRFEREARAISALNHPNICTLYDVGHQDGVDFLVMEFVEGETLSQRLAKGALPVEQVLKTGYELADALDKAHRSGIVHRDLKPGNIMLTKSGAKLLDFGLAKPAGVAGAGSSAFGALAVTQTSPTSPITQQGSVVGTFQYMSPEQVEGKEADARSDIFALGAVLYEMTTGKRAFEGKSTISVASAILEKEPDPISRVQPTAPPALEHVVETCLKKDAEERFQTAHDVKLQLKWIAEGGSQAGVAAPVAARRRHREWLAWGLAAVLSLVMLAAGWLLHAPKPGAVLRGGIALPPDQSINGVDTSLAFSPDGRKLALTLIGADGKSQIWLRSMDSMTMQPLAGTSEGTYPTWSPDGQYLAFFAEHKLKKVDVTNGAVQTLCAGDDGRGIAWGPNGQIVFVPGPYTGLSVVPAAGGEPSELTHPDKAGVTHRLPQFLPDGDHVLFFKGGVTGDPTKDNQLEAISLKTKTVSVVQMGAPSGAQYVAPGYLLYVKERNLVAQAFDAGKLKLTGDPVPIAEQVQYTSFRWTGSYAASSTGLLAYRQQATSGKSQLTWLDLDGKELGKVGDPVVTSGVALSPDGTQVILQQAEGSNGSLKLFLYDLKRKVLSRFTFGNGDEQGPQWSPDGKRVAFAANRGQGWGIYQKEANGSAPEELVYRSEAIVAPSSWTPDGKLLAFIAFGGASKNGQIWVLPMTGDHKPYRLHPSATANEANAGFSPDGHWILYQSDESGRNEIYLEPFPGPGGRWQISQGGGGFGGWLGKDQITWGTTEFRLMAETVTAKGGDVQFGTPKTLFGGRSFANLAGADIPKDGKRMLAALPAGERTSNPNLDLVVNWPAELKK